MVTAAPTLAVVSLQGLVGTTCLACDAPIESCDQESDYDSSKIHYQYKKLGDNN
jgi:hypothetical protein